MQKLKTNLRKLLTILLSRFKTKNQNEQWVKDRIKECNICPHNTKNIKKISLKQKIYRVLSNLLTFVTTGKFNEDDSECNLCGCTLSFKVVETTEKCNDNRWKY